MLGSVGFIANRRALARELRLEPVTTDAAIFEALWNRGGAGDMERVCGAFTAVLWDGRRERLILAVDRLGAHPLYVHESTEEIVVSPELENLVAPGRRRPKLNRAALIAQLHGQALPAGATFFCGIAATKPATLTELSRRGHQLRSYWALGGPEVMRPHSGRGWVESLRALMIEVAGEYASGEPAGITLSSGLDSTSLALALARAQPSRTFSAFSWSAPELPDADETSGASAVSERLGLHFVPIRADRCWTLEGDTDLHPPLAGPPLTFFARLWRETFATAKQHGVELLFTGASGDHLFGGRIEPAADLLLQGKWGALREELAKQRALSGESLGRQWRHRILGPMARAYWPAPRARIEASLPWLDPEAERAPRDEPTFGTLPLLPGRRHRWRRLRDPLLPRILAETTLEAHRAGVSLRHPLVDHRLLEFAAALPTQACYHFGVTKAILRELLAGELPAEVVERPAKIVPNLIAQRGLREREVPKALELMANMRLAALGLVNEARLRAHYRRYVEEGTGSSAFWHTLSLEAWLRCHGDDSSAA